VPGYVEYLINQAAALTVCNENGAETDVGVHKAVEAINEYNKTVELIQKDIPVDIFSLLGMRNLSSFLGEIYAQCLSNCVDFLISNPHQDGYPDLLLLDSHGKQIYDKLDKQRKLRDKSPFSPFANGGIEVKATCGSVPSPAQLHKKGLQKPLMGEQRIDIATSYDWKAHHRETNQLLGLYWDFRDGVPFIAGVFYSSQLEEEDWGKIVKPKDDGGRTTSVSIMSRTGIKKMYLNWIAVVADERYCSFLDKKNNSRLLTSALSKGKRIRV
jgi:hypothetical protein